MRLSDRVRRVSEPRPARPPTSDQLELQGPGVAGRRSLRRTSTARGDVSGATESLDARTIADREARLLLLGAVVVYITLFLYWTFRHHDGLGTTAFDLGIFDQGVWLLSRFESPFITINGRNLFGDHTSFILLPWALVYRVIPSPKVLLASQTLALGLGAWPAFLIAREKLRSEMLAALLAVAYLLHPVLGWTNYSEGFHPDAFEIPLVLLAFWYLMRHRWVGYGVCVAALLLVKEDVAFLTFALGIYVALRHNRRVGLITCAASTAYLAAAFWLIIPAFLGGGTVYTGRIPFGGPIGFVNKAFTQPGQVVSHLATEERAWYLWQLFAPLAFVPWWAPTVALVAIGPLALNLISSFPYQFDVRHHYGTLIFPVLVVAAIFGVASAPRRHRHAIVGVIVAASLCCAYLWSPTPGGRVHPWIADPGSPAVASFRQAVRFIPRSAVVSAYYRYVPQISHRQEVFMFPNPWKASYWGTFEQEGQRLPQADRVQYVILPVNLNAEEQAVLDGIRGEFIRVYDHDAVQLFVRRA